MIAALVNFEKPPIVGSSSTATLTYFHRRARIRFDREAHPEHRERPGRAPIEAAGRTWSKLSGLEQDTGLVFTSGTGTPLDVGNLTNWSFRLLLERAGLPRI